MKIINYEFVNSDKIFGINWSYEFLKYDLMVLMGLVLFCKI